MNVALLVQRLRGLFRFEGAPKGLHHHAASEASSASGATGRKLASRRQTEIEVGVEAAQSIETRLKLAAEESEDVELKRLAQEQEERVAHLRARLDVQRGRP